MSSSVRKPTVLCSRTNVPPPFNATRNPWARSGDPGAATPLNSISPNIARLIEPPDPEPATSRHEP